MSDIVITAANVVKVSGATVVTGIAGETITAGQSLYLSSGTGKLMKADADASAAAATTVGIALNGAADGQPLSYITAGQVTIGATIVAGTHYFVSPTAGGIMPSADLSTGEYASRLGYGASTSVLQVDLKNTGVLTA